VVARAVEDYLEQSRQVGRLLNPVTHLKIVILQQGFSPPGIQDALLAISKLQPRRKRRAAELLYASPGDLRPPEADEPQDPPRFPDPEELIELILTPGPKPASSKAARLHKVHERQND
jgi:hypothetical protein